MPLFGVDVSEFQGSIDWHAVSAAGVTFAVVKATEGTTYTDPRWAVNLADAERAEIPVVGAYHFLTATSSPFTQADAFCRAAPPDILHALDVEAPGPLDVRAWVDRYRQHHPTHPLLVYTGKYLWSQRAQVPYDGAGFGPLWVAGAAPGGYVPGVDETPARSWARVGSQGGGVPFAGWTDWTLMQFSESCRVPGIPTRVDANAYRGTLDQLRGLTGQETNMPLSDDDAAKVARAVHNQLLFGSDTTIGKAIYETYRRPAPAVPTASDIAAVIVAQFKTLPVGTATVDDATIAKLAKATIDELNARLVR